MPETGIKVVTVFLLMNQVLVRTGIRLLLESRPGFKVIGEAEELKDACLIPQSVDVIVTDLEESDITPELYKLAKAFKVIMLAGKRTPDALYRAITIGARGLVLKEQTAEVLICAIKQVVNNALWFNHNPGNTTASKSSRSAIEAEQIRLLTERETQVVALVTEGLRNKEIACRLFISESTVRHHLRSVFEKLSVSSRFELLSLAYKHGLTKTTS